MRISICIPTWEARGKGVELLIRCLDSVKKQNFKDYEIVISDDSEDGKISNLCDNYTVRYIRNFYNKGMAENTNYAIKEAKGDLIKILYQDDWLEEDNYLQVLSDNFKSQDNWLITASSNNPSPHFKDWNQNTLGSPSALSIRNDNPLLFKSLKFFLDLEFYQRMFKKFGDPKILTNIKVGIGLGEWQETNNLTKEQLEADYLKFMSQS